MTIIYPALKDLDIVSGLHDEDTMTGLLIERCLNRGGGVQGRSGGGGTSIGGTGGEE